MASMQMASNDDGVISVEVNVMVLPIWIPLVPDIQPQLRHFVFQWSQSQTSINEEGVAKQILN